MSQSNSSRSSQGSLPALKKTHYANGNGNHQSQQLVHPSTQGKFVMDDVISSQGSIKRDVMRNSESVQAVRQESIMLAEKVQHATNLYRQLAARVGKTEERYEMEQKSMGSILGKAKQIEMQLIQQQEQLVSKEGQLALQVHKLQEEVVLLKNEREQYRRQIQSVQTEVRTIADKITHQSGALANGLQDLKSYLDQKEMEKKQELNTTFSTMQGRIDTIEHKTTISQAKTEGRCEKLALQITQNDKQRQEDVYQIATTIREKEAMTKADVRRLDEKVKVMFEDVMKGSRTSEGKMKTDFDVKFIEIERKVAFDQKDVIRRMSELEEEVASKIKELVQSNREEMDTIASDIQEQLESSQGVENLKREVKHIDKTLQNHQKDIEKVLRAEISSRVSQGDKLNTVLAELKKDNVESLGFLEATFSDHKRKHEESMELVKKELVRYVGETIKANKCAYDETRFNDAEKKMDEMEDALEELAKQEERIGMNSEQLKQIEMENILAQGDMNISIDTNTKELTVVKDSVDDSKKKVKLIEKKLMFLAEAFENYKSENRITPKDLPSRRSTLNSNSNNLDKAREKINKALTLIKDILQLNLIDGDPDTERRKNQKMLKSLERELQYLSDSTNPDSEDENTDNEKNAKENDDKKSDNDEKTDDDDNSDEDEPDDSEEEEEEEESDKEEEGDKKKKKKKDPPPKEKEKDKKKKKDDEAKDDAGKESDDDESDEEPEDDEEWSDDDDDDDDDDESDVGDDGDDDSAKDSDENDDDDNEEEDKDDEPEKESDGKDKPKNDKKDKKKPTKDDKNEKDKNKKNDKKKKEEKDKDKEKEESDEEEPGNTDDEPDSENEDDPKSDQNDNNKSETEGSDNEDNDKKDEQSDNDKKQRSKKDKPKKSNPSDSDTGSKKSNPSDSETGSKKGGKRKGKNK